MNYSPFLMIGLLMLVAVAGSSRFVQVVSVKDHMWKPAPARPARHLRLAHAALLLLVVFWSATSSQAPVRNAPPAVEAGREATHDKFRPCRYVKQIPRAGHYRVC